MDVAPKADRVLQILIPFQLQPRNRLILFHPPQFYHSLNTHTIALTPLNLVINQLWWHGYPNFAVAFILLGLDLFL
jgi:hypothetical protein